MPPTLATLRMLPPSLSPARQACCVQPSTAVTLTSKTLRTADRSASTSGPYCGFTAALLTSRSSRPKRSTASATASAPGAPRPSLLGLVVRAAPRGGCHVCTELGHHGVELLRLARGHHDARATR